MVDPREAQLIRLALLGSGDAFGELLEPHREMAWRVAYRLLKFGVSEEEYRQLVSVMQQEWEEHHTVSRFTVVLGRKPG